MPLADLFSSPTSYRLVQEAAVAAAGQSHGSIQMAGRGMMDTAVQTITAASRSSHPDFGHLTLLVFEAVLEVVCVSLPGYIVARMGMFDAESQKFLANLNVQLFTPCLIFTKLASQLTADKLAELAIIPIIFVVQTMISYMCAWLIGKCLRFKKRQSNFVIAMGVFGNSNSLPISLVLSLSKTLKGLHWDRIPGDNDEEVGARGILYLLIFQQLGQLVRWTWGYNVLLAPADTYTEAEGGTKQVSQIERGYHEDEDESFTEDAPLLSPAVSESYGSMRRRTDSAEIVDPSGLDNHVYNPNSPSSSTSTTSLAGKTRVPNSPEMQPSLVDGAATASKSWHLPKPYYEEQPTGLAKVRSKASSMVARMRRRVASFFIRIFRSLPVPLQRVLSKIGNFTYRFLAGLWEFMNPPLWAMLIAIIVASIPKLQHLFFDPGTFVRNSVTRAIQQSGGVAVPLILVVLGGNLARNTLPKPAAGDISDPKEERKLLIASLVSRMVLPTVIMAPLLAVTAKFVQVSILDDKIFIIVCFLLTGAPTALQLAQICQINNVYMPVMGNILFQSYVIWILPSTLVLVLLALETVSWAET